MHDMQMARGTVEGGINGAVGEPIFLQETVLDSLVLETRTAKDLKYPTVGGEPELIEELRRSYDYKHIVVANGGKQAIEAAFYAFRKEGKMTVNHEPPYWPSYPTLANSRGLGFNVLYVPRATVTTSPNNPDGSEADSSIQYDLWDAAYASPVYNWSGNKPVHRAAVFSAAKLFGLSGIRVGWLGTNNDFIAEQASKYVEISTSGVSILSQMHLLDVLQALRSTRHMSLVSENYNEANFALYRNGDLFQQWIGPLTTAYHGVPWNGRGMFAFFRVSDPPRFERAIKIAKVSLVTGEACGMTDPGWYRMSMGLMPSITERAVKAIFNAY